ncbi:MAG: hypothetical protein HQM16_12070 [Deltaproteobacteria bacterium]|nr:hypothetical protein [Deltaproteobacteria bacterium]
MWKDALCGAAVAHCEGLKFYRERTDRKRDLDVVICRSVVRGLNRSPFYLKIPLKIYASFINVLCLLFTGRSISNLPTVKRQKFVYNARRVPLYDKFNRFIRSKVFIKLFEYSS